MSTRRTRDGKTRKAVTVYVEEAAYRVFQKRAEFVGRPWTISTVMAAVLEHDSKQATGEHRRYKQVIPP